MAQGGIEPEKVTKPIQLVAAWFAALVLLVGAFLGAASVGDGPSWLPILYATAAVLMVPFFAFLVFRLQTRYRPELQEDPYYSKWKAGQEAQHKGFRPENLLREEGKTIEKSVVEDAGDLPALRENIYVRHRGLFLIHTWLPSKQAGHADISVRLYEHGKRWKPLSDGEVDRVEYYLGEYFFDGKAVTKTNAREDFRLDISAYGTTNCVARVHFKDGATADMYRYLDFRLSPDRSQPVR